MIPRPDTDLLRVEALEAAYGGVRALSGVDLAVRAGEILALAGSNGAGKTTLLRAVARLLPATGGRITAGRVLYAGRDIARSRTDTLVRAGLVGVLEGRHCFRSLSIEENLIAGGLGRGSGRADLRTDLQRIYALFPPLAEKRALPAGLVSGGEQQMVAIGRALMGRPRLLVLDEPSMGLAPRVTEEIYRTLVGLNRDAGLTLLVAEQNVALALRHAHRCVVLETGRTVLQGPAHELRARDDIRQVYLGLSPSHRAAALTAPDLP